MGGQSIEAPAGYVPVQAVAFADRDGTAVRVSPGSPMPVAVASPAGTPLEGAATGTATAGPFVPAGERAIWVTLAGDWSGTVTVLRAIGDGPAMPLSVGGRRWAQFAGTAQEPVACDQVAGARYFLDVALTAGTLAYRVAQ